MILSHLYKTIHIFIIQYERRKPGFKLFLNTRDNYFLVKILSIKFSQRKMILFNLLC